MMKYIAYYRVSTKKQGNSGLGLQAQTEMVKRFLKPDDKLITEFTEVESGKVDERPELNKAIQSAKQNSAKLLIAKLDRLSRNASFIFQLKDTEVDFVAVDMPEMNTLTVGMMAVIAQHEREMISSRTKAALERKKAQGFKLGSPDNLTESARLKGLAVRKENALNNKANKQAAELAIMYRDRQLTFWEIASRLNDNGYTTRRGKQFSASTVKRLYDRYNCP
jgi:DNA invertase Pin-like site-specific DNA recombinase